MWVKRLQLQNIRGFENPEKVLFSRKINLLIGPNNSGKSTIIKAILNLQYANFFNHTDLRLNSGVKKGTINIELDDADFSILFKSYSQSRFQECMISYDLLRGNLKLFTSGHNTPFERISGYEPRNFIYPFLSSRKVTGLSQDVRLENTQSVPQNLNLLNSKIDRIANPQHPNHSEFMEACRDIIGLSITSFSADKGKCSGLIVNSFENIPLESMGDGVMHLVALIENLCMAENKLFLIEELENDIHPKALKKLLQFIISKSKNNQFIISTHSNIVTKYLGSENDSKIFNVTMHLHENRLPTSQIKEINNTKEERIKILMDLGYDIWDFEVWKAWLILEESSSERIIRDFLIPWFVPELKGKLRTVSANGTSKIEASFEDFRRLFAFIHLENIYKNKAWVIADGDKTGIEVVSTLKNKFPSWSENNFQNFSESNFEKYYPAFFEEKVKSVLEIVNKDQKREAKKELLNEVLDWTSQKEESAKKEFEKSAAEIIVKLKKISKKIE